MAWREPREPASAAACTTAPPGNHPGRAGRPHRVEPLAATHLPAAAAEDGQHAHRFAISAALLLRSHLSVVHRAESPMNPMGHSPFRPHHGSGQTASTFPPRGWHRSRRSRPLAGGEGVANGDASSVRVLVSPAHPTFHRNALDLLAMKCPDSVSGERSTGHSRMDRCRSLRRISSETLGRLSRTAGMVSPGTRESKTKEEE